MKKFMISIPEDKKRPDVNDLPLLVSVPVEKALSIQWKDYWKIIFLLTSDSIEKTWEKG